MPSSHRSLCLILCSPHTAVLKQSLTTHHGSAASPPAPALLSLVHLLPGNVAQTCATSSSTHLDGWSLATGKTAARSVVAQFCKTCGMSLSASVFGTGGSQRLAEAWMARIAELCCALERLGRPDSPPEDSSCRGAYSKALS